jgi:hypothetical protein
VVVFEMVQEKLYQFSNFGWFITKDLYILHKVPREGTWESFMEQFLRITTKCSRVNFR